MSDRLFGSAGFARADARVLVTTVVVAVYDRGPSAAPDERYEAELARLRGGAGGGRRRRGRRCAPLVGQHRTLLERRWAPGGPASVTGVGRPRSESARVPVIRTAGGLVKRLGRAVLWLLVLVLLLRGLASVLEPREPTPAVHGAASRRRRRGRMMRRGRSRRTSRGRI